MGRTSSEKEIFPVITNGNVLGTYVHGIFDEADIAGAILKVLFEKKGIENSLPALMSHTKQQEKELDRLADELEECLDMELIHRAIGI